MFAKMNNYHEENQQKLSPLISKEINNEIIQQSPQINKISSSEDNLSELLTILKEIPLHNLNDYYNIETNVFKKRIEKLNLQFFWIYESILEAQNTNNNGDININTNSDNNNNNSKKELIFPYNKLFLILFKEISLYIEEILRLNKQINAKNKNEKFYLKKLNDYKNKEKEYYMNKHIIKTLQRNIRNLEKSNEKLKNEIEKLNKKIFNAKYANKSNESMNNNHSFKFTINNNVNNYRYKNYQKANTIYNEYYGFNNFTEQGSVMSSDNNKFSIRTYMNKFRDKNFNEMNNINKSPSKDFLNVINKDMNNLINSCSKLYEKKENIDDKNNYLILSINQCQDEINNLNMIENLLNNYVQSETENEDKILSKERNQSYNKLLKTPISYKFKGRRNESSTNIKSIYSDKRYKKMNASLDFKSNIISNRKKS